MSEKSKVDQVLKDGFCIKYLVRYVLYETLEMNRGTQVARMKRKITRN